MQNVEVMKPATYAGRINMECLETLIANGLQLQGAIKVMQPTFGSSSVMYAEFAAQTFIALIPSPQRP